MRRSTGSARLPWDALWLLSALLVLAVVVVYWRSPIGLGFNLDLDWRVIDQYGVPPSTEQAPRRGDRVVRIGDVTFEEWRADRTVSLSEPVRGAATVPIEVIREGERMTLDYPVGEAKLYGPTSPAWILPFMFWAAGTATGLLARPRSAKRRLLALFWFGTAIWLAAGYASFTQVNYANVVLHVVLWLTVAALMHLHLLLPWGLGRPRARKAVIRLIWAVAVLLTVLDALRLVPRAFFLLWLLLGIAWSLALICYRLSHQKELPLRAANRLILAGTGLGSSPLVVYTVSSLVAPEVDLDLWTHGAFFVSFVALLPIWPLSYLYAVHRHAIGGIAFRANRVLAVWAFGAVLLLGFMAAYLVVQLSVPESAVSLAPFLGLVFTALGLFGWKRFQRWVNRLVFGIRYDLEQVLEAFTQRIPRAREVDALRRVVVDELLPTLMVRQSLICLQGSGEPTVFARLGLTDREAASACSALDTLLGRSGRYLLEADSPVSWVRLAIPLRISDNQRGVWLFGRRDPDDFYPGKDIETLTSLANVVASVLAILALLGDLKRSETKYRAVFEEAKDAIYLSTVDGRFVEVNQAALDLFGYDSKKELFELDIADDLYDNPADRQRLGEILERQGFVKDHEVVLKRKDGKQIVVLESATQMHDPAGHPVGYQGILRDLTERREIERKLRRSERMEAIGRLAGGVAHDFNNLLTVILGNTELLTERSGEDDLNRELLDDVSRAGKRAQSLTRQLLAFGRRQMLQPAVFDLRDVVDNTVALLEPLIGENIELVAELGEEPLLIEADLGQIQQVILNLALNARDAMPKGGHLSIRTSAVGRREHIAKLANRAEDEEFALCQVTDDGVGIAAEDHEHVFEPFFTSKSDQGGTGLGLATAYGIVRQSGGHVLVRSKPGRGSSFEVYLPRAQEVAAAVDAAPRSAESPDGTDRVILLVEDQPELRRLASKILERAEFETLVAPDGASAIDRFGDRLGGVDLLVTDVVLPGMSGPELARRMTGLRGDLKVLLMTGYGPETAALDDAIAEGHHLLQKPFKPQDLLAAVRDALGDQP